MANGTGVGMGLGARTTSTSTGKKSTSRTGGSGKKSTGPASGGAGGRPGVGRPAGGAAGRPISGGVGGGRPNLVRMGQLLSGGGAPRAGGIPGAGVPAGMPVSVGGLPVMSSDPSQYDFGMQNMGDAASLDFGPEAKTPASYISGRGGSQIGSVSEQDVTDFYNNLTMSKLENLSPEEKTAFDERMAEATKRKESLRWPEGVDPELMERRITAAESERWPNSADFYKELRSLQTEPTTLQNVGSMLKTGAKGAGDYLKDIGQGLGLYQRPLWPSNLAPRERRVRGSIIGGEGTPVDQRKAFEFIRNKRAENYAAGITVPPGKEYIGDYERGYEKRVDEIPYGMKFVNAPDLLVPPKPSTYEAPKRTLAPQPQQQYLPRQQMPQGRMMSPGGAAGIGKDREKKETFNLLEMLMGLLGLNGGKGKSKETTSTSWTPEAENYMLRPPIK